MQPICHCNLHIFLALRFCKKKKVLVFVYWRKVNDICIINATKSHLFLSRKKPDNNTHKNSVLNIQHSSPLRSRLCLCYFHNLGQPNTGIETCIKNTRRLTYYRGIGNGCTQPSKFSSCSRGNQPRYTKKRWV